MQKRQNNTDGKTFQEYHKFGLILKDFVNKVHKKIDEQKQEIHQLKIENRKLRSFLRTETVELESEYLEMGRQIDDLVVDETILDEAQ